MTEELKKVLKCACELKEEFEGLSPIGAFAVCATFESRNEQARALAEISKLEKKLKLKRRLV